VAYTFRHGDRPLEGYTIQRAVGRGGFGEVYYALSDGGREVALKYLRDNPNVELRGVSHCINLKSPHLVSIFDVKKNNQGDYFVIMEYVSGPSLRDLLLAEPNGLGPQKAAFFIREIAKGLAYLHDRGIVHRDMKPGNIFYDEGYVKIGDYGLSKFISVSRHSVQTASVGTVHYMAPEVGSGNYHRGIDIYALGVMLYEMLLGKVPFEGGSMGEVLMKHLTVQPEVDNLPAPFAKVIRRALEKDPAHRYQTVYEMVDDLLEVADVQHSLAGFNPASLSTVARRGAADPSDSPAPSPNPPPRWTPPPAAPRAHVNLDARGLPPKLAKRMSGIGAKVSKRLKKLDAKHGAREVAPGPPAEGQRQVPRRTVDQRYPIDNRPHSRGEVIQRLLLALAMAVGLGVGLGFLVDAGEEGFASSIMMIVGMAGGLTLGIRFLKRIGRRAPAPKWIERACVALPTACLLGIGVAAFADRHASAAAAVWLALLIVTFFTNWREHVESGTYGEMSIWKAGKIALFALILTVILAEKNGGGESGIALGVGVAAASSFVLQALAWLFPLMRWMDGGAYPRPERGRREGRGGPPNQRRYHIVDDERDGRNRPEPTWSQQEAASMIPSGAGEAPSFVTAGAPRRRLITRLFAGVFFFVALAGLVGAVVWLSVEAQTARSVEVIAAWTALGLALGLLALAMRKMTRFRTGGVYRDTLRPLLMTMLLAGFGFLGSSLVMGAPGDVDEVLAVTLLILLAMAFLFLLVKRGWRYPRVEGGCSSRDADDCWGRGRAHAEHTVPTAP
jgi:serine/threonine protein kinase